MRRLKMYTKNQTSDEKRKRRLLWAGYAWQKVGLFMYLVRCGTPVERRPIGRSRLRSEDQVMKDVKQIVPNIEG